MTPNANQHAPHPDTVRNLVKRIDKSQQWIANRIGISERRLRYLIAGTRDVDGKQTDVLLTYPEQFALEELASAAEVMRMKTDEK
jgi:3-oxoacyl-[acyl-carrier-protein] synthase III